MNLHCPHCGEPIVARGFGKCPRCYEELPEELQLTEKEKEFEKVTEESERQLKELQESGGDAYGNAWTPGFEPPSDIDVTSAD